MDLTFFPFDTQRCRVLLLVTSTFPVSSIPEDYQLLPADVLRELASVGAEWTFVNQSVEEKEVPGLGDFATVYLEYTITMTRKTTFFVISFIAPVVLTSYMNTVVFLVPVESGERTSYLVTIFVSTAVFVSFSTNTMPQVSLALHRYHGHQQQAEVSSSDKDHDSRTAANVHKYAPANHALHNIGDGHAATNHVPQYIPDHEAFKIDKSHWRKKDCGETPRDRAKKLAPFSVLIPSSEIWRPEVLCANGATTEQSNIGRSLEDNAVVHKDGTVEVKANLNLEFTCKMDLTFFPFDTQRCRVLLFVTSTVPISSIPEDYQLLQADALRKLCSVGAEWTFVEQSVEEKEVPVLGGGSAVYLEYTITMTRKTTFFVISFIVPIVLTSYMNTVVFLIPVESGDRISYLVSIFVSTAVFVGFSTDTMPQGLNEIPLIMYFITGIMMESAVLIILVSLALHRYHDHQQQAEASDSDKDHESRTAANGHKYAPANHALHNIGNGHAATNQALRDITDPSHETFKIDKSDWRKKDGGETPRERAKKLDMILFVHTFVINSVFVASIIGCLVIQKD
nr:hypothetical protein BaRGS_016955 [Batillaria attramentaria]